ncbi:MAG: radical SAM protein [Clostridiales bacterium]|nr:radical SAM protein [Clostridiales bacterium]
MYYRLTEPYAFRGYKGLPYAIRAEQGRKLFDKPLFFGKEPFLALLYCNGTEPVELDALDEKTRAVFQELLSSDILSASETPMAPLKSYQRYHVYPSRYLERVQWSITGRCNFRCRHCLVSAPDGHHPEPTLDECLDVIRQMEDCGVHQVDITGGEPLVRRDCEAIFRALSEHRVFINTIFTNASLLTGEVLDLLKKHGHHPGFQLSFDGLGCHDWLRGVPGAEKQADAAFRLLKERGFHATAAMCVHRKNRDSLRDTVNYLARNGVSRLRVNAPQALGLWKQYARDYALTNQALWDVIRDYIPCYFEDGMPIDIDLDGYFSCKRGSTAYKVPFVHHAPSNPDWHKLPYCEALQHTAYISPEGHLLPCMSFSDTPVENHSPSVFTQPLGELTQKSYYADLVATKLSDLLAKEPECAQCPHLPDCCGGCMQASMTEDGDYLVRDKDICWFFHNVGEAAVRAVADAAIASIQPQP